MHVCVCVNDWSACMSACWDCSLLKQITRYIDIMSSLVWCSEDTILFVECCQKQVALVQSWGKRNQTDSFKRHLGKRLIDILPKCQIHERQRKTEELLLTRRVSGEVATRCIVGSQHKKDIHGKPGEIQVRPLGNSTVPILIFWLLVSCCICTIC